MTQESSDHVRKNLLMGRAVGAEFHFCSGYTEFPDATAEISARCLARDGMAPYIIPSGGTNAVGALGFVNAALELAEQIQPDVIYIPMGTGGTVAGLLVGFLIADCKPRIEGIRVVEREFRDETHIKTLCDELCEKLDIEQRVKMEDIIIRDEFFGEGYGISTPEGKEAIDVFQTLENVVLENTYTGKTAAALLHDLRSGALDEQTVLYWNTLNSCDFSAEIADVDPLPVFPKNIIPHRSVCLSHFCGQRSPASRDEADICD